MLTALERLGRVGPGEDGVGEGPAAVRRRFVLVEVADLAADVVAEARRRHVQVEEDHGLGARVVKRVQRVRRRGREHARQRRQHLPLGPERQLELAVEHVEGVRVVVVDVLLGPVLAGCVAEPRQDQLVELAEDAERLLRPVGNDLALAGRG